MFRYNGRLYGKPHARSEHTDYADLTREEEALVPWAQATVASDIVTTSSVLLEIPITRLSERYPEQELIWVKLVPDREIAVLMGLHPRLGAGALFNRLECLTVRSIILQSLRD